jgi:hypothetical protein
MPGVKGKITRSLKGKRSVYLSNVLGLFHDRGRIHLTSIRGKRFHTSIGKRDGPVFTALMRLYRLGRPRRP